MRRQSKQTRRFSCRSDIGSPVSTALDEVRAFRESWGAASVPAPVAAVHLRTAVTTLEELIGAVDIDDVLDEVFPAVLRRKMNAALVKAPRSPYAVITAA
jgi:tRNA U34 5-carboxymethylaminomethyl modifying GTPase MnmE/TrmE